jgi:hypothetical protein
MCKEHGWPTLRLDGSVAPVKRTKLVDEFNNPFSGAFAFLLSSKAGGCGINLIGGNRLVLFDPDWNPASDKQAAGRIWREGQKRRCYIYRFMSTGSIEEKIIQRQLSKEGLMNIVDDKDQLNEFSTIELKGIFNLRTDTRSDTHDTLRCKRCSSVQSININTEKNKLNSVQIELCSKFLNKFSSFLINLVEKNDNIENQKLICVDDLTTLNTELLHGNFPTLPLFSRKLRQVISGLEELELEERTLPEDISINEEFLNEWSDVVPLLNSAITRVNNKKINNSCTNDCPNGVIDGDDNDDNIDDEYVEQEGMPDETDFNKWSHHCNVNTCDDSSLKTSMSDDNAISFIFGLEVNWSLLIANEIKNKEKEEIEKEEKRVALIELNEKRSKNKEKKENGIDNEINIENFNKNKSKSKKNDNESNSNNNNNCNYSKNDFNNKVIDFGDDSDSDSDINGKKMIINSVTNIELVNIGDDDGDDGDESDVNNYNLIVSKNKNKNKRKIISNSDEDDDDLPLQFQDNEQDKEKSSINSHRSVKKVPFKKIETNAKNSSNDLKSNERIDILNNSNNNVKKKKRNKIDDSDDDTVFDIDCNIPSSLSNNSNINKDNKNKDKSNKTNIKTNINDKENIIKSNNNNNNEKEASNTPSQDNCSPDDKEWSCTVCTYVNEPWDGECNMCK